MEQDAPELIGRDTLLLALLIVALVAAIGWVSIEGRSYDAGVERAMRVCTYDVAQPWAEHDAEHHEP